MEEAVEEIEETTEEIGRFSLQAVKIKLLNNMRDNNFFFNSRIRR